MYNRKENFRYLSKFCDKVGKIIRVSASIDYLIITISFGIENRRREDLI